MSVHRSSSLLLPVKPLARIPSLAVKKVPFSSLRTEPIAVRLTLIWRKRLFAYLHIGRRKSWCFYLVLPSFLFAKGVYSKEFERQEGNLEIEDATKYGSGLSEKKERCHVRPHSFFLRLKPDRIFNDS